MPHHETHSADLQSLRTQVDTADAQTPSLPLVLPGLAEGQAAKGHEPELHHRRRGVMLWAALYAFGGACWVALIGLAIYGHYLPLIIAASVTAFSVGVLGIEEKKR